MNSNDDIQNLRRERDYYRRQADEIAGDTVRRDYQMSALRHALKQREQGFALLCQLQKFVGSQETLDSFFSYAVQSVNTLLGMNKTLMLTRHENGFAGEFAPATCAGYAARDWKSLGLSLSPEILRSRETLLVNGDTPRSPQIEEISAKFELPFFILQPIVVETQLLAFLLCGRSVESKPFAPPLDEVDVDTLQSIGALIAAFVSQRNSEILRADNASLRLLATIDTLTGILNRRGFEETLASEWKRAARSTKPLSLILLDVDHFKNCNDNYGHDVGDAILHQLAERIGQCLRPSDINARYGGEEFAILLPETDEQNALGIAERIREQIQRHPMQHQITGNATFHSASMGVCTLFPHLENHPQTIVTNADKALYQAKSAGRNCVKILS